MFPDTRWTLVLASRQGGEARRIALETLLGAYWRPLYLFARRKGLSAEAAEDAVQGFFLKLLELDFPDRLDPARGRLGIGRRLVQAEEREERLGRALAPPVRVLLSQSTQRSLHRDEGPLALEP